MMKFIVRIFARYYYNDPVEDKKRLSYRKHAVEKFF